MAYQEDIAPAERLVTLAVTACRSGGEDAKLVDLFRAAGPTAARRTARANHVEAMVGATLRDLVSPEQFPEDWENWLRHNGERVRRLVDALRGVTERLDRIDVKHAVIEAGGVMLGTDLPFGAYGSSDLDLLVDRRAFHETLACFEREGFEPKDRRGRPTRRIELGRQGPGGNTQWLEVGFAPFDRMWVPLEMNHRCDEWLERRVPADARAEGLWVLRPEDALALVAVHTSLHSYVRAPGIRLHTDVDRLVQRRPIDWAAFGREISALGASARAAISLEMARALLGTPIPSHTLEALAPPAWRREAILRLLSAEGVFVDAHPKLPRGRTILLDALIHGDGPLAWLGNALLPHEAWLREHFDRQGAHRDSPTWQLHLRRARLLMTEWSPR